MFRRNCWQLLFLCLVLAPVAAAQSLCDTTASSKVACTLANAYGPDGLSNGGALALHNSHTGQFGNSALSNFNALNSSIGSQLAELPLVSPASGISFSFDKSLGVFVPSQYNFGPILSERAGTLGRHKLLVGYSFQNFDFSRLDGIDLNTLPAVYFQQPNGGCAVNGANTGGCAFIRDVIVTQNTVNLRVRQYTAFVSFGVTSRLDVSLAIPTLNVNMSVTSTAGIRNNGSDNNTQFQGATSGQACSPNPCFNRTFFNSSGATGLGDLTARAKYEVWQGERQGLAVGADIRFPTGDELNYLGAGAYGIKPFLAWSLSGRIAPHFNIGYQWNGKSYLAGNITTTPSTKAPLPYLFFYTIGAEAGITKRLSAGLDFIAQDYTHAAQIQASNFQELGACTVPPPSAAGLSACNAFQPQGAIDPNFTPISGSYWTYQAAPGLRFRALGNLLLTGNVLIQLNNTGLVSRFVPLVGLTLSH